MKSVSLALLILLSIAWAQPSSADSKSNPDIQEPETPELMMPELEFGKGDAKTPPDSGDNGGDGDNELYDGKERDPRNEGEK